MVVTSKINDEKIEGLESAIYLEQKISCKKSQEEEIERRTLLLGTNSDQ